MIRNCKSKVRFRRWEKRSSATLTTISRKLKVLQENERERTKTQELREDGNSRKWRSDIRLKYSTLKKVLKRYTVEKLKV